VKANSSERKSMIGLITACMLTVIVRFYFAMSWMMKMRATSSEMMAVCREWKNFKLISAPSMSEL
jgi:hypothetical protein